jgi:glycine/D-amino acid oxidase-like deaminating enzyme
MAKEPAKKTVVVVGAGLVGAMTAVFLGRRGYKVPPRPGTGTAEG